MVYIIMFDIEQFLPFSEVIAPLHTPMHACMWSWLPHSRVSPGEQRHLYGENSDSVYKPNRSELRSSMRAEITICNVETGECIQLTKFFAYIIYCTVPKSVHQYRHHTESDEAAPYFSYTARNIIIPECKK
jgi:hypothetical protein